MTMGRQDLAALWLVAMVLAVIHVLVFSSESVQIDAVHLFNLLVTVGVLPFAAGFICRRRLKTSLIATGAAGASITVATIGDVGVAYLVTASGWPAFAGFILATAMFTLIPSAVIGVIGGWVARKYEPSHI
jgi:predicted permease